MLGACFVKSSSPPKHNKPNFSPARLSGMNFAILLRGLNDLDGKDMTLEDATRLKALVEAWWDFSFTVAIQARHWRPALSVRAFESKSFNFKASKKLACRFLASAINLSYEISSKYNLKFGLYPKKPNSSGVLVALKSSANLII